jgi:hypothetical protein
VTYLLLFVAAVLPAVLLVWFFHARDTFPEPPRVLWTTFALGCASIVPAVLAGVIVEPAIAATGAVSIAAVQAFVIAALCEESSKLAVLLGYSFRRSEFDEPMDGIVYGATVSLGFAALENVLYVLDGGFALAVARGVLSVPGHATYGAVMGYYVGRARFDRENRARLIGLGLLAAVMLHGFYNFPLMLMGDGEAVAEGPVPSAAPSAADAVSGGLLGLFLLLGVAAVVVGWTWSLSLVRRVRREQALAPPATLPAPGTDDVFASVAAASPRAQAEAGAGHVGGALPPAADDEPAHPATAGPASRGSRRRWRLAAGWLAVLGGGAAASAGGLLTAAAVIFALTGEVPASDHLSLAVGISIIGVAPAVAGVVLFVAGVRALNRGD